MTVEANSATDSLGSQEYQRQQRSLTDVANREQDISRRLEEQYFLTTDVPEREKQINQLGKLKLDADELVEDILEMLSEPQSTIRLLRLVSTRILQRWRYSGVEREDLRKHLVNAALLQLDVRLLLMRAGANRTWLQSSANAPDYRHQTRGYTDGLRKTLHKAPVSLSALNVRTIALALRSWSDELSIPATGISGWLEAAIPVSRDLRYLANSYHTRWLWKSVTRRGLEGGIRARVAFLAKAIFDSAFRILSGYGLRGRRFVSSLIVIIMLFAMGFYAVNVLSGCRSWWSADSWVNLVASVAFLVGDGPTAPDIHANATCTGTGYVFGAIGVTETGVGYLMLGLFVSLLYAVIQRRSIDTSSLVLSSMRRSAPALNIQVDATQEVMNVQQSAALEVNTQADAPHADDPEKPD